MKKAFAATLLLGFAALVTPASADTVVVRHHGGPFHGCRVVKHIHHGPFGRRVEVRKVCH